MGREFFEGQGRYPVYDRQWDRVGLSDKPQYPGQMPLRFPPEWTPFEWELYT